MQNYIIKSFRRRSDGAIFERQEAGTNSGGYTSGTEVKRLNDFLCDGAFSINSVLRCEGVNNRGVVNGTVFSVNEVLTINDRNTLGAVRNAPIVAIFIELSEPILSLGAHGRIRLINATKLVVEVAQVIKKGPGRPKKIHFKDIEESIERVLEQDGDIRLEKTLKRAITKLGVQGFLIKFFKELNSKKHTVYASEKDTVHTVMGKRRSLGDVFMLCKYYFPEVTLNEVIKLLYVTLPAELRGQGFRTSYCTTIRKRVWYYSSGGQDLLANTEQNDEYGYTWQYYIDNLK